MSVGCLYVVSVGSLYYVQELSMRDSGWSLCCHGSLSTGFPLQDYWWVVWSLVAVCEHKFCDYGFAIDDLCCASIPLGRYSSLGDCPYYWVKRLISWFVWVLASIAQIVNSRFCFSLLAITDEASKTISQSGCCCPPLPQIQATFHFDLSCGLDLGTVPLGLPGTWNVPLWSACSWLLHKRTIPYTAVDPGRVLPWWASCGLGQNEGRNLFLVAFCKLGNFQPWPGSWWPLPWFGIVLLCW